MDEPHAYDFLLYAYLQSAQDDRAKWVLDQTAALLNQSPHAGDGGTSHGGMSRTTAAVRGFLRAGDAGLEVAAGLQPARDRLRGGDTGHWARSSPRASAQAAEAEADLPATTY